MTLKMSELREKDTGSLQQLEKELQENLFAAKLQKRTGQLENTAKIALTKRDLARVKTVLRARELGLEVIEGFPGKTSGSGTGAPVEAKKAKKSVTHDGKTEPTKAAPKKGAKPSKAKVKAKAAKPAKKTKAASKPAKKAAKGGRK